ncbi:MAG: 2-C-methyl-D-erythritol 4-phosphate cytidylyltransferase [Chloroflexota bacterium]
MTALPERVGAVIVAAGRSERMGFDKLWADLAGRPVLAWSIAAIVAARLDELVIVASVDALERVKALALTLQVSALVVPGGARRRDSVSAGLAALPNVQWVAVHDAARPLVTSAILRDGLAAARDSGVAVPALPVPDTVKLVDGTRVVQTLPRAPLRLIQTPQIFRRDILAWALTVSEADVTDEAGLIESLGGVVTTFPGQTENFKLTYPADLALMHEIVRRREAERKATAHD